MPRSIESYENTPQTNSIQRDHQISSPVCANPGYLPRAAKYLPRVANDPRSNSGIETSHLFDLTETGPFLQWALSIPHVDTGKYPCHTNFEMVRSHCIDGSLRITHRLKILAIRCPRTTGLLWETVVQRLHGTSRLPLFFYCYDCVGYGIAHAEKNVKAPCGSKPQTPSKKGVL